MIWHLASRAVYAAVTCKWEEVMPRQQRSYRLTSRLLTFYGFCALMKAAAPLRRFTFSSTPIGILFIKYLKIKFSPPTVNGTADNKQCRFFSIVSRTFRSLQVRYNTPKISDETVRYNTTDWQEKPSTFTYIKTT